MRPPGLADEGRRASFREVHVRDKEGRVVLPNEFEALRGPFGLAVDPKMVQSEQAPEEDAGFFISCGDHRRRRRGG